MQSIKRLGVAYGKLGISTDADLIGRRGEGVMAAAGALETEGLAPLVQSAFDLGSGDERFDFLSAFEIDPTFDVGPTDREARLLAGAVVEYEIENGTEHSAILALTVVATACGSLREPVLNDHLIQVAQSALTSAQGAHAAKPKDRTYQKQPQTLTDAIAAIANGNTQYFQHSVPTVTAAFNALGAYAESSAQAAARSDNQMLAYVRGLEQEMRTYWWVAGGFSEDAAKPFRLLPMALAALLAGKELANKHTSETGLFAAPALIDMILERGRSATDEPITFANAVLATQCPWRSENFAAAASAPWSSLLPVSAALALSAQSADAEDWKPQFKRLTGLASDASLPAAGFAAQLYRERLVARALG